jgi:thiamine biosynthesis lipoprotein
MSRNGRSISHPVKHQSPPIILAALLLCLAACQPHGERNAEFFVFGTLVEVKLWGASEAQAGQAFAELQQMFQGMHRDWHAWEPGRLTDINRAFADGAAAAGDHRIIEMIRRSQEYERLSEGRFNPAIGALVRLWGFHTSQYPIMGPPPSRDQIEDILRHRPSTLDIGIAGLTLRSENPHVQLDFGGIAKGYAVDLAIARLRELGIDDAIVNAGGDLRAMGRHGDRPWRVAVRKPGGGVIGAVEVRGDESLFTSGNYERFRLDREARYPHILDPRTGWPVGGVVSATVITGTGIAADAAATALVVAGLDEWPAVAARMRLDQVLVIDDSGAVYLTPQMAQRVRFTEDLEQVVIDVAAPVPRQPLRARAGP